MSFFAPWFLLQLAKHVIFRSCVLSFSPPMSFSAPNMCHFLPQVSFFAPSVIFCPKVSFSAPSVIFCPKCHVENNSSSVYFDIAKVCCSREVELMFRFGVTDHKLIHARTYCTAVCVDHSFAGRFESTQSALKVEQKPVLRIPKGAHTKHRHVPTSRRPIGTDRHSPVLRSLYPEDASAWIIVCITYAYLQHCDFIVNMMLPIL